VTTYIADYEIISEVIVSEDDNEFRFSHPEGTYNIAARCLPTPAEEDDKLSIQVILDSDNIYHVEALADKYLREYLIHLAFITNCGFSPPVLKRIIDWTPGIDKRSCLQFNAFPDIREAVLYLDSEHIGSCNKLLRNNTDGRLDNALRWFANGVESQYYDEQFQFFWFVVEILAELNKDVSKIPDSCPHCHGPLYCQTCEKIPTHRPYSKQAIRQLIANIFTYTPRAILVTDFSAEEFFNLVDSTRNALMHGKHMDEIEKSLPCPFNVLSDLMGKVSWAGIARSFRVPENTLVNIPSTYIHQRMKAKLDLRVSAKKGADVNNPRIEDFP